MKFRTLAGLMLGSLCLAATALAQTAWKPTGAHQLHRRRSAWRHGRSVCARHQDALDRLKLTAGEPVIVENKVGAGGAWR